MASPFCYDEIKMFKIELIDAEVNEHDIVPGDNGSQIMEIDEITAKMGPWH